MRRWLLACLVPLCLTVVRADVFEYVAKPDDSFTWAAGQGGPGYSTIDMTSQTWQGIPWKHVISIYRPDKPLVDDLCVLVITGGNFKPTDPQAAMLGMVASQIKLPVAVLWNIPNQPLFEGKTEDALIAYTLTRAVATKDESWPLLFPMTKSAVRAMDALQAQSEKAWGKKITRFITTGASKRGWTTWFTGAVDKRVCAIMPMVYDNLNIPEQMAHQIKTWGSYSPQIHDYTEAGLQQLLMSDEGKRLASIIDPYTYRDKITMPKLIICGTNDRYWTVDALTFYRDKLVGETNHIYVPNSGHGLNDLPRVFGAISGFARSVALGGERPKMDWKYTVDGDKVTLRVVSPQATKMDLWTTSAEAGKFYDTKWVSQPMAKDGDAWVATAVVPQGQQLAAFGEATYADEGRTYTFSTGLKLTPEG